MIKYGYEITISPAVHGLIEEWESTQVAELLASGNFGSQINFYWLVKNMLGNIVE